MGLFHTQKQDTKPQPRRELSTVEQAEVVRLRALVSLSDSHEGKHLIAFLQDRLAAHRALTRIDLNKSIERNGLENAHTDGAIYELGKILETIQNGKELAAQILKGEE